MSRFLITYFPCRGRQETIQLLFEIGCLSYETVSVDVATWKADKKSFSDRSPFGQVPILEDKEAGLEMYQSQAIYRYLSDLTGMSGRNPLERALVDEACETTVDLQTDLLGITWDKTQFSDLPAHRERCYIKLKQFLNYFIRRKASESETRWISSDYLSLADVRTAVFLEALLPLHKGLLEEEFPQLFHFNESFHSEIERVREYVLSERRFKTWTLPMAVWGGQAR